MMERIRVARFKTCSLPPDCPALQPASLASFCVFLVRGWEKQALPESCQAVEELLDYSILFSLIRQWNWLFASMNICFITEPAVQIAQLFEGLFIWAQLTGLAQLPGWILPWVHMRNFSPVSEMRKGQRSWVRVLAPNLGNKANIAKHKNFNFRAYLSIGNS